MFRNISRYPTSPSANQLELNTQIKYYVHESKIKQAEDKIEEINNLLLSNNPSAYNIIKIFCELINLANDGSKIVVIERQSSSFGADKPTLDYKIKIDGRNIQSIVAIDKQIIEKYKELTGTDATVIDQPFLLLTILAAQEPIIYEKYFYRLDQTKIGKLGEHHISKRITAEFGDDVAAKFIQARGNIGTDKFSNQDRLTIMACEENVLQILTAFEEKLCGNLNDSYHFQKDSYSRRSEISYDLSQVQIKTNYDFKSNESGQEVSYTVTFINVFELTNSKDNNGTETFAIDCKFCAIDIVRKNIISQTQLGLDITGKSDAQILEEYTKSKYPQKSAQLVEQLNKCGGSNLLLVLKVSDNQHIYIRITKDLKEMHDKIVCKKQAINVACISVLMQFDQAKLSNLFNKESISSDSIEILETFVNLSELLQNAKVQTFEIRCRPDSKGFQIKKSQPSNQVKVFLFIGSAEIREIEINSRHTKAYHHLEGSVSQIMLGDIDARRGNIALLDMEMLLKICKNNINQVNWKRLLRDKGKFSRIIIDAVGEVLKKKDPFKEVFEAFCNLWGISNDFRKNSKMLLKKEERLGDREFNYFLEFKSPWLQESPVLRLDKSLYDNMLKQFSKNSKNGVIVEDPQLLYFYLYRNPHIEAKVLKQFAEVVDINDTLASLEKSLQEYLMVPEKKADFQKKIKDNKMLLTSLVEIFYDSYSVSFKDQSLYNKLFSLTFINQNGKDYLEFTITDNKYMREVDNSLVALYQGKHKENPIDKSELLGFLKLIDLRDTIKQKFQHKQNLDFAILHEFSLKSRSIKSEWAEVKYVDNTFKLIIALGEISWVVPDYAQQLFETNKNDLKNKLSQLHIKFINVKAQSEFEQVFSQENVNFTEVLRCFRRIKYDGENPQYAQIELEVEKNKLIFKIGEKKYEKNIPQDFMEQCDEYTKLKQVGEEDKLKLLKIMAQFRVIKNNPSLDDAIRIFLELSLDPQNKISNTDDLFKLEFVGQESNKLKFTCANLSYELEIVENLVQQYIKASEHTNVTPISKPLLLLLIVYTYTAPAGLKRFYNNKTTNPSWDLSMNENLEALSRDLPRGVLMKLLAHKSKSVNQSMEKLQSKKYETIDILQVFMVYQSFFIHYGQVTQFFQPLSDLTDPGSFVVRMTYEVVDEPITDQGQETITVKNMFNIVYEAEKKYVFVFSETYKLVRSDSEQQHIIRFELTECKIEFLLRSDVKTLEEKQQLAMQSSELATLPGNNSVNTPNEEILLEEISLDMLSEVEPKEKPVIEDKSMRGQAMPKQLNTKDNILENLGTWILDGYRISGQKLILGDVAIKFIDKKDQVCYTATLQKEWVNKYQENTGRKITTKESNIQRDKLIDAIDSCKK